MFLEHKISYSGFWMKNLHICYSSLLRHRFWEIAAATIEERFRQYESKTRCFCPSVSKATRQGINGARPHLFPRLRSPLLQRATMPAQPFSRFFHHTAFTKLRNPTESGGRVCLSGASYTDAEKSEWRMALKI